MAPQPHPGADRGAVRDGYRYALECELDFFTAALNLVSRRFGACRPPNGREYTTGRRVSMQFEEFSFGSIRIDGVTYNHDVVIDRGEVRKRKKKPSRKYRQAYGHTPLSMEEEIPWKCKRLVIGAGTGALPVMDEVKREARRRKIKLVVLSTAEAVEKLKHKSAQTNAILHVTC